MKPGEYTTINYTTHRGRYRALAKLGSKHITLVMIDHFPIPLQQVSIDEARYMDKVWEIPADVTAQRILDVGKRTSINEGARKFLEGALSHLPSYNNTKS